MKNIIDYILSTIHILYFGLVLVIFDVLQRIAYNLLGKKAHQKTVNTLNMFLVNGWLLTGSKSTFQKKFPIPEGKSILFIANHQSMFDIPGIIWFLRKYTPLFVSKKELGKGIPSISYNLRVGGAALIDRKNKTQSLNEIKKLGKYISDNQYSVAIFPEGTRSRDGKLKNFSIGGVATILDTCPDCIVVPIAIKNTGKFLQKGLFPVRSFTPMSWTTLKPIDPKSKSKNEILEEAKEQIAKELDL